jgi:chemotaxis protein histidine kinase CheA
MANPEHLAMLATETGRRTATIIEGVEQLAESGAPDPERVEALRAEAHGLIGAAAIVDQPRLAQLAERIERILLARHDSGTIDAELAARLVPAATALHEGAQAVAEGAAEPPTVAAALAALAD